MDTHESSEQKPQPTGTKDTPAKPSEIQEAEKAIAIHNKVNENDPGEEKKDAEQWRNEG